jgi:hypothetical protein
VVKPDQLIKRRGKSGLLLLNATWEQAKAWITERMGSDVVVDGVRGVLSVFIVEPFLPHAGSDEYYICMQSHRFGEEILFHHEVGPFGNPSLYTNLLSRFGCAWPSCLGPGALGACPDLRSLSHQPTPPNALRFPFPHVLRSC